MRFSTLAAVLVFTQGCATLHHGSHQNVAVVTDPAGANVAIDCGRAPREAVTPATLRLPRRVEHCALTLMRTGFQTEIVVLSTGPNRWFWANFAGPIAGGASGATRHSDQALIDFLIGAAAGGIGFGIDALTGAMWELEPARVERKLIPK